MSLSTHSHLQNNNNNQEQNRIYAAIDLKSFYASVECVERQLNPLTTNLVVADISRTEKTICLAVSPSLKSYGIPGRARLFQVIAAVQEVNKKRLAYSDNGIFTGESYHHPELVDNPNLKMTYITAMPRMALYVSYSTKIYDIYLRYIAPEDIHVYSIDEVFLDLTQYLKIYHMDAMTLVRTMIQDILKETGITATAGIGTNLYLCKIAMDIMAKRATPDENGVRIAFLDELEYRKQLWNHRPLTDFWRIGSGYAEKLQQQGLMTMGDVARCSLGSESDYYNEDLLYKLFGVNAELLIDHAWGYEPVTIADIKAYKPENNSSCSGQVLSSPYPVDKARLVVWEMADGLALDLVSKKLLTDQLVLTIGYDTKSIACEHFSGEITTDAYGRDIPKHAHGTANLKCQTSSSQKIIDAVMHLFDRIIDKQLYVRRISLTANHIVEEGSYKDQREYQQLDLFSMQTSMQTSMQASMQTSTQASMQTGLTEDVTHLKQGKGASDEFYEKERKLQEAMLAVKKRYGKNAILKGVNLEEGATMKERNSQIGGHKA